MQVSSTSAIDALTTPSANASTSTTGASTPTHEEFLKLFVAELQNQDPLKPRDGSEMVAEMAQFAGLEQTAGINSRLDALAAAQASSGRSQLLGLVGHKIEASASSITTTGGGTMPAIDINLDRAATKVTAIVRDAAGKEVRRIDVGPHAAGKVAMGWDGTGPGGTQLPPGTYSVEIDAVDANGASVGNSTMLSGIVESIQFADGGTRLKIGDVYLNPSDVSSVGS
jgi:flagellar basal-body rod modification protein FlgD